MVVTVSRPPGKKASKAGSPSPTLWFLEDFGLEDSSLGQANLCMLTSGWGGAGVAAALSTFLCVCACVDGGAFQFFKDLAFCAVKGSFGEGCKN